MIVLPRALARQFRAILRRCLQPPGLRQPPWVRLHTGPQNLEMAAHQQECCIVYQQPGKGASETLFFPADVLADIQGKDGSATLETTGDGKGEARWDDAGVPRCRPFETMKSEKAPELPAMPTHFQPVEPAFLHALAEAARTTAHDGVRFALTRIQVRGRRGQLVATDGRQLLVQGGFSLPWPEDVLIPALPLFASRDLPAEGPMALGRSDKHVSLRTGPWTFHLEIDTGGHYPNAETVIPKNDQGFSRLHLSEDDARFLAHVLPRLPGDKDDSSPVTLDLGKEVLLRARSERSPQINEVCLVGSPCEGPPVRVACNRRYLWRLVQLGFRDVVVRNATTPLVCRDATRIYLFMPLDGALAPAADAVRIVSDRAVPVARRSSPKPQPERSKEVMPRPPTNGEEPRHGPPTNVPPAEAETLDLLAEAEALRSLLHDAQMRLSR
ncbi:MAG: hypothetical protein ACYC3I_21510, partial [Gemmataceae bacterium]